MLTHLALDQMRAWNVPKGSVFGTAMGPNGLQERLTLSTYPSP
jgi:hypothetical protein